MTSYNSIVSGMFRLSGNNSVSGGNKKKSTILKKTIHLFISILLTPRNILHVVLLHHILDRLIPKEYCF